MSKYLLVLLAAAFTAAMSASAWAAPGNGNGNGPPPHAQAPANAGLPSAPPPSSGPPAAPPGNSGSNPHGGPPGITGQAPTTPASGNGAGGSTGGGSVAPAAPSQAGGQPKVTICHNGQSISVAQPAVPAHQSHGDSAGACSAQDSRETRAARAPGDNRGQGQGNGPAGKIEICHATGSATNPFVVIEISVNGLNGHLGHSDDIVPAPAGGCASEPPGTVEDVLVCHRVGENRFELIEVAVGDLSDHRGHGDVFAEDGECPGGGVRSGTPSGTGGPSADAGPGSPGAVGEDPASAAGGLPFTGLAVGGMIAVALALLAGGAIMRRSDWWAQRRA